MLALQSSRRNGSLLKSVPTNSRHEDAEDLPIPDMALYLRCDLCGRQLLQHDGHPPDCGGFMRPALPPGYAYASTLTVGAAFRFVDRALMGRTQLVRKTPLLLDDENGLVELRLTTQRGCRSTYLVQGTTIVRLIPVLVPDAK